MMLFRQQKQQLYVRVQYMQQINHRLQNPLSELIMDVEEQESKVNTSDWVHLLFHMSKVTSCPLMDTSILN